VDSFSDNGGATTDGLVDNGVTTTDEASRGTNLTMDGKGGLF
jgi:hypothetical protein